MARWTRRACKPWAENLSEAEAGRHLFELTAACRANGIDPEGALRLETARVMREVEAKAVGKEDYTANTNSCFDSHFIPV